ncbi:hypothetical protein DFH08DRAFT_1084681 [Mycena albidolilacea]|uniref:Uncharacterized protein n=1 Tax=Mycena albidolilacea TaxID=1033008 RepID=A0AAD6ZKG0_9AGAR|nr:hypothetical protein DFH08DRAFT_1084681 [Mycena albidolilacea]
MATTMRRPTAEPTPSRAAQRNLLELENEQRLEDTEVFKFTDEKHPSLFLLLERQVRVEQDALLFLPHLAPATVRTPTLPPPAPALLQAGGTQSARVCSRCRRTPMGTTPIPTPRPQRTRSHTLNPHTKLWWPRPQGVCRRRPPRVLRQGRHHLRAAAVTHLPISHTSPSLSTHSTHAVTFPVSPNRYAAAPTPTPTYVSTLTPPTPRGTPMPLGMTRSVSSSPAPVFVRTSPAPGGDARGSRGKRRSPVKGLFPFSLSSALSASATQTSTPCPMRAPLPPLVCVYRDAPEEDDEDVRVDEDEDKDDSEEEDGDEELPTPVRWRFELLAPRRGEEPQTPVPYSYEWEATPMPYSREEEREGGQVGGKRKRKRKRKR